MCIRDRVKVLPFSLRKEIEVEADTGTDAETDAESESDASNP